MDLEGSTFMKPKQLHKVLFVDDDPDDLQLIKEAVREASPYFIALEAHNGQEALDFLHHEDKAGALPCLVVVDINMPIMDGKEAVTRIRNTEAYNNVAVIVFTTSAREADKNYFNSLGVNMITKPSSFSEMKNAVRKILLCCKI